MHEAGAFLLGIRSGGVAEVRAVVFYDELDPQAYDSGVCVLYSDAFSRLWSKCRDAGLTVVADVHTHPRRAVQSSTDRTNPMIAQTGHIAIIVPNFAANPVSHLDLGVYEYLGGHEWRDWSGKQASTYFHVGFWS